MVSRWALVRLKPVRSRAPCVALIAATPQNDAGRMVDPTVCVPSASGTIRAATAAADPLDEAPAVHVRSCGLRVGVGDQDANSVVTVLPTITAPASRSRWTAGASTVGR